MNDNQNDQGQKAANANNGGDEGHTEAPEQTTERLGPETAAGGEDAAVDPECLEGNDQDTAAAEIADLKDRLLRTMAEMENLRKRAERDRQDATQYAITGFARDLLDVADNLRRALEGIPDDVSETNEALKPFIEGVDMTERTLLNAFEKHGIERFSPEGAKFDHNYHEAMFEAPTNDHPNGTVIQVVQPGYTIKSRLLRPARVGVARNTSGTDKTAKVDQTV